ncbi:MAG: peptidylprolyl isomerase [Dysgonamonadaceae bacterium]|jgi:FKBP-type peptidyl-prolyl cis-trans isomerase SlyD|nr:peptidylprolyl isomerase [Dysgonamonadaceae bacterium]
MKISPNKYVALAYDLSVGEEGDLELMEQATAQKPLEFIFGTNSMLEAFESNIEGLAEGETFSFVLTPEQAYGDYDDTKIIALPKKVFEVDGKIDDAMLFEGNTLPMMDSSGNRLMGSIVSVADDKVSMDFNHPLAGEFLHFTGSVVGVREASAEEIAALFSQCGCGCNHDHEDGCEGCGPGCS